MASYLLPRLDARAGNRFTLPMCSRLLEVTSRRSVAEEEYAQIEKQAEASGQNVGEWCREVILAEVERGETPSAETILAEIMALRMVFLNTVQVLGQKGDLPIEQLR
jgi:hypothetical protein